MKLIGWMDDQLSPRIKFSIVLGTELELVVDTGFNGELVLPKTYLKKLGFRYRGWTLVELADGSEVPTRFYEGTIIGFGKKRKVRIHKTESEDALLGTQMLIGYIFELDIEANKVVIAKKAKSIVQKQGLARKHEIEHYKCAKPSCLTSLPLVTAQLRVTRLHFPFRI